MCFSDEQCEVACLGFDIAVSCVAHSCSVLSLSPIKDELPQYGEVVMGDMYRYRNDSSKLTHVQFVERFSCVFLS